MIPPVVPIEDWPQRLEDAVALTRQFERVIVLQETDSTQDAAKRLHAAAGTVVVAARQTAGRGRLGRPWADTLDVGVACSFLVSSRNSERLAAASALGAAIAVERVLGSRVSIKWPNDVYVNGRKLAGVLIEQSGPLACVGIGINVNQGHFEGELAGRATSLAMLGSRVDRVEVIVALMCSFSDTLEWANDRLAKEYDSRCLLKGCDAELRSGPSIVRGRVERVNPLEGLEVLTQSGRVCLPAANTTVNSLISPNPAYDEVD